MGCTKELMTSDSAEQMPDEEDMEAIFSGWNFSHLAEQVLPPGKDISFTVECKCQPEDNLGYFWLMGVLVYRDVFRIEWPDFRETRFCFFYDPHDGWQRGGPQKYNRIT
jgi:hypothetical protein